MKPREFDLNCPIGATMKVLNGKWKIWILFTLATGTKRFSELMKLQPSVTQRMLTAHLRELEQDKIIIRKVYPVVPPKVEYSLSDIGETLRPILQQLQNWGNVYIKKIKK
jgi:DNA-binding HxlR family transcriptional regulator